MLLSNFDYQLPSNLIASTPNSKRDNSQILFCQEATPRIGKFHDILDFFHSGDLIIMNDSKVIKSNLELIKAEKPININLNKELESNLWLCFARPAKRLKPQDIFLFTDSKLNKHSIEIIEKNIDGDIIIRFNLSAGKTVFEFLDEFGSTPLPLYIKRKAEKTDISNYQTVYHNPNKPGSAAAPTAGLHFTEELMAKIRAKGVNIAFVTLHIGGGTFLPIKTENINDHKMHYEHFTIPKETADAYNKAKKEQRRIIAVGTTTIRSLESAEFRGEEMLESSRQTNLFIKPGYKFKSADYLITNFHLPKSTLMVLVSSFAGFSNIQNYYEFAIANKMRFFSYGDCMLLKQEKLQPI